MSNVEKNARYAREDDFIFLIPAEINKPLKVIIEGEFEVEYEGDNMIIKKKSRGDNKG